MSWQNAPVLRKLTASQQGGNRGAQLWGVDIKGTLYTIYQKTPGGDWSNWLGPDWNGPKYPKGVYELAAAQRHDGCVQLWVLDMKREIWTTWQSSPGGNWNGWQGPGWNKLGNLKLKKIAAVQLQPTSGQPCRLWGISEDGILTSCHEIVPAGNWSPWNDWTYTPEKSQWVEITACRQGDGKGALWGLDNKLQLWGMGQAAPGGNWGGWAGPGWVSAPKVRNIAAVEMSGQKGACIWAIKEDYTLIYNVQSPAGSNNWAGWKQGDRDNKLTAYELTAAGQNNGLARVWAVSLKQMLHSQGVKSDSKDWEGSWTPPAD
jgi:hypothetical protein